MFTRLKTTAEEEKAMREELAQLKLREEQDTAK